MIRFLRFLLVGCLLLPRSLGAQDPGPVVHAVLFYSPTCPHCHQVITEYLIPLQNRFGNSLVILGMDTTQPQANNLWWEAIRHFGVPEENWAVPFLVVGQEVLVGGIEIPNRFTTLVEEGLAASGIDLPDYPALRTFLQEQDLLDPRFPDRMVMRPRPVSPEEDESAEAARSGEQVAEAAGTSGADATDAVAAGTGSGAPTADSVKVGDTAVVGPAGDSMSGGDTAAQGPTGESARTAEDAAAEASRDSARASENETVVPESVEEGEPSGDIIAAEMPNTEGREGNAGGERAASPATGRDSAVAPGERLIRGLDDAASDFESMTMWDRFGLDPVGNGLSVLVLLVMTLSLGLRGYPPRTRGKVWPAWTVPLLVVLGVFVASYLSFVEVSQVEAVCGPVGDCNTVNQSEYARLFGVLPVGVLGLVGYGVILLLWALGRAGPDRLRRAATLGVWVAVLFGVLFSVYLTFLEPFVIGASCAWCLTSAMIMTLLLWASAPMAARAWPEHGTTREDG